MAEEAKATFQGERNHHRKMWKHYVLIFINIAALVILFQWIILSNINVHNEISGKIRQLAISSLIFDKMMMELRDQSDNNYNRVYAQQKKVDTGLVELKTILRNQKDTPFQSAYIKNIETIQQLSKHGLAKAVKHHGDLLKHRSASLEQFKSIISQLKAFGNGSALSSKLIELKEAHRSHLLTPNKISLKETETLEEAIRTHMLSAQYSNREFPKLVGELLASLNAETRASKLLSDSNAHYANSARYTTYTDFNDIYKNELREKDSFSKNLRILFYLLILGAGLQFIYLIYEINHRNKQVLEQAEELKQGLENQKELNELQRKFVSMVSHEFRTPLAIIDSGAQKMLRRADALTPNKIKEIGFKTRSHINKLIELLDSTLHSQRMEAGAMELMLGQCDLKLIIGDVCQLQYEIHTRNTIQLDISNLPPFIIGDDKLIAHVVTNLVSNAVKYSPDGTEVVIIGRDLEDSIEIEVRDQGVGIPSEEISELFECFYRASTSIGISGTGIGLHLVKNIIDRHHGNIEVTSAVGQGATFIVRLPKTQPGYKESKGSEIKKVA